MLQRNLTAGISFVAILLMAAFLGGCSPRPPIPYQTLQIQDTEESRGYDVYLYVAIQPEDNKPENVKALLKWFNDVKFAKVNKVKVFIWKNPQGALINSSGDLIGTLNVDRATKTVEINADNPGRP